MIQLVIYLYPMLEKEARLIGLISSKVEHDFTEKKETAKSVQN